MGEIPPFGRSYISGPLRISAVGRKQIHYRAIGLGDSIGIAAHAVDVV